MAATGYVIMTQGCEISDPFLIQPVITQGLFALDLRGINSQYQNQLHC